jgi:hypothetical protein
MADKNKFSKWYKERIESNPEFPPGHVWEDIKDDLDIADTWQRIDQKLNREKRVRTYIFSGIAAAAVFAFLLLADIPFVMNPALPDYSDEILITEKQSSELSPVVFDQKEGVAFPDKNFEPASNVMAQRLRNKEMIESSPVNRSLGKNLNTADLKRINSKISLLNEGNKFSSMPLFAMTEKTTAETEKEITETENSKNNYYFGFSGQMNNSLMLSNKTIYSINESPYSQVRPQQSGRIGLVAGLKLSERLGVQTEFYVNNLKGQTFREYRDGQLIDNQIQLGYSSLQFISDYKFIKSSQKLPFSHHILLGLYGSYLKNASQSYLMQEEDPLSEYKKFDAGFIIGYSLQTSIMQNVSISADIRLDPGIINIYEGSSYLPKEFNRTYNSSFLVGLSFTYNFQR